jgi:hypothetical protein
VNQLSAIYEADLALWAKEQADALRRHASDEHASNEIDWKNVAEEIEAVGRSERREIKSRLEVLLIHLLKWRYQPDHQSKSWLASIDEARSRITDILEDSPSLKAYPGEALADAYRSARNDRTINYLDNSDVPQTCPWAIEEVLAAKFLPA